MAHFVRHQVPILMVANVQDTLEYYRDRLRGQIAWKWEESYGSVYCGECEIHFALADGPVAPQMLYWFVEDVDEVYRDLSQAEVAIAERLGSRPWGMKEFAFRDNNGHLIRVGRGEKPVAEIPQFTRPE
jgi:uncharacterized glyoxalase superfamily protein PhnB